MVVSVLKDAEGHHLKALCRELRGKDRAEDTVIWFDCERSHRQREKKTELRVVTHSITHSYTISSARILQHPGFNHDSLQVGQSFRSSKDELSGDLACHQPNEATPFLIERRFLQKIYLELGIDVIPFKLVCEYEEWIPWYNYFREWLYECYSKLPKELIGETLPIDI